MNVRHILHTMSDQTVPMWTLGDRLAKAREGADISVQRMADLLGVSRTTISNYEHDRTEPNRAVLLAYASETNVPIWWLEDERQPVTERERYEPFLTLEFTPIAA